MVRLRPGSWEDRVAPIPPCPCQDSPGQGVAARHLYARRTPQVSSRGNHSGRLRHIRSPLAGETPATPLRVDRRAPRPGCVLTDLNLHRRSFRCSRSPRRPVVTARKQPCVFHTRGRCARVEPPPAPFASRHRPSGWSNIRPDRSRLASSTLRCAGLFARRPGPKPVHDASPAGGWRPGGPCPAAPVTGRGGRPSAKPPADDLAVASPEASPPFLLRLAPHAGFRRTAHTPGLPRKVRKGRARLYRLQPLRRAPPRSPKRERTVGGEGGQRGSCCRVPDDVLGRGSRERPSPGRLACVAGRSRTRIPRWAGAGRSEDRP